jgi:hypothetical protein
VLNILVEVLKQDWWYKKKDLLWAACDKITSGKCKINWEIVCKPNDYGGLGILNLAKSTSTLRMTWIWNEWNDKDI